MIAIIGAGISGLAAAQRILRRNESSGRTTEFVVFEASDRVGGVISTRHENGFLVEESSDNFITTNPWAIQLCDELGLRDTLTGTDPTIRKTFVVRRGRLHPLPDGFLMMAPTRIWPMALTPILSPFGKLRAAMEYILPRRHDPTDESVRGFATRRLGREVFERLIEPLVSAVYAADMDRLSVDATLPQFRDMEREHRSLICAMRANAAKRRRAERTARHAAKANLHFVGNRRKPDGSSSSTASGDTGARYSLFMTPRDGLETMATAIRERIETAPEATLRLGCRADRIEPTLNGRYRVTWRTGGEGGDETDDGGNCAGDQKSAEFDSVILAVPSHQAASIVQKLDPTLAAELAKITHSGTAVLTVAFRADQVRNPLRAAGAVVPSIENLPLLAISFSNRKYPHRAPDGTVLLRVFAGGAKHEPILKLDDAALRRTLLDALRPLLSIEGEPIYATLARWERTMPQFHIGHRELVVRIREHEASHPRFALAGNFLDGVGIPHCIHTGWTAAERCIADQSATDDNPAAAVSTPDGGA